MTPDIGTRWDHAKVRGRIANKPEGEDVDGGLNDGAFGTSIDSIDVRYFQ